MCSEVKYQFGGTNGVHNLRTPWHMENLVTLKTITTVVA